MKEHYFLPDNCPDCPLFYNCRLKEGSPPIETKKGTEILLTIRGTKPCTDNFDSNGGPVELLPNPPQESKPFFLHKLPKGLTATR